MPVEPRLAIVFAGLVLACHAPRDVGAETTEPKIFDAPGKAANHQVLRDRTTDVFTRAAYSAPLRDSVAGNRIWMAPLLVHELAPTSTPSSFVRFGALTTTTAPEISLDTQRLTVYMTSGRTKIGDRWHQQQTYLWFYPPTRAGGPLRWRGFRQTLSTRGFPYIREAISSEAAVRLFFVAKSLETAAVQQFRGPLPGRRYAVERDCQSCGDIVVARVLPDGPQPMGPYVYIDQSSLAITTMKCRCEPSQVGSFPQSVSYGLMPVESITKLFPGGAPPNLNMPVESVELDLLLRLPRASHP